LRREGVASQVEELAPIQGDDLAPDLTSADLCLGAPLQLKRDLRRLQGAVTQDQTPLTLNIGGEPRSLNCATLQFKLTAIPDQDPNPLALDQTVLELQLAIPSASDGVLTA